MVCIAICDLMLLQIIFSFVLFLCAICGGLAQSYSGVDGNGNYYYGRINSSGSYSGVDGNGNYHYGRINDSGSYSGVDGNGNYYYGRINR
jgi:hypothetical protein